MDFRKPLNLAVAALALASAIMLLSGSCAAQPEERAPDLSLISGAVSITAPDIELGKLLNYVSEKTGTPIVLDRRFSAVRLTVLGGNGSAAELLEAVQAATGLQLRRLDDWYVLSPDRRGAAAVAHAYRRREGRSLMVQQATLSLRADAVARRAASRFWPSASELPLAGLTAGQRALLQRQGFLTVADLFPEYYEPMYDIFGNLIDRSAERPASLPEFAGARVYFYPSLQILLRLPAPDAASPPAGGSSSAQAQPLTWSIDLGGF